MSRNNHLLNIDHARKLEYLHKTYLTVAKIVIKYGSFGDGGFWKIRPHHLAEFWKYSEPYPSPTFIVENISVQKLRRFIKKNVAFNDGLWSGDFLHGLILNAQIKDNINNYPSVSWLTWKNNISKAIETSPFGGKVYLTQTPCCQNIWSTVPALCLNYSENKIDYLAGVLAGAQLFILDGAEYAAFSGKSIDYLIKCGIPIEHRKQSKMYKKIGLISPIWPALFSIKMPPSIGDHWTKLKKPYNANLYASILWKTYMNNSFPKNAIPYLKPRRSIYYEFRCEEGAMNRLSKMRVEKGLTTLDNRIKEIVKIWGKKFKLSV